MLTSTAPLRLKEGTVEQLHSLTLPWQRAVLTRLVSADFDAGCLAGGPSVQVLPRCRFVADVERQNEAAWVRPAQAVIHLRAEPQRKNAVRPHFARCAACRCKSLCEWFFHLVQSFPWLAQVLDEIIVDGPTVVCAAQVQHQEAVLLKGVDLVEGGDGFGVVLQRADLRGQSARVSKVLQLDIVDENSFHVEKSDFLTASDLQLHQQHSRKRENSTDKEYIKTMKKCNPETDKLQSN